MLYNHQFSQKESSKFISPDKRTQLFFFLETGSNKEKERRDEQYNDNIIKGKKAKFPGKKS